jgi:hypothetical protein
MPLMYKSGEEIKQGDRVMFHGEPGEIEFVADPHGNHPETDWFVEEYRGGVMIIEPKHFGRAFLIQPDVAEDLIFVSRRE